jgi:hypothetical protein
VTRTRTSSATALRVCWKSGWKKPFPRPMQLLSLNRRRENHEDTARRNRARHVVACMGSRGCGRFFGIRWRRDTGSFCSVNTKSARKGVERIAGKLPDRAYCRLAVGIDQRTKPKEKLCQGQQRRANRGAMPPQHEVTDVIDCLRGDSRRIEESHFMAMFDTAAEDSWQPCYCPQDYEEKNEKLGNGHDPKTEIGRLSPVFTENQSENWKTPQSWHFRDPR